MQVQLVIFYPTAWFKILVDVDTVYLSLLAAHE